MVKPIVLIIEDDHQIATLLKYTLQDGFEYICVESVEQASQISAQISPDVVLLDLHLPDSNGIDTFWIVKPMFPLVPIVIFSGFIDPNVESNIKADAIIRKASMDLKSIVQVVSNAIISFRLLPIYEPLTEAIDKSALLLQQLATNTLRLRAERTQIMRNP